MKHLLDSSPHLLLIIYLFVKCIYDKNKKQIFKNIVTLAFPHRKQLMLKQEQ